jgi:hypothetical protein
MDRRDPVTASILEEELRMFQAVPSAGGRAPCQEDVRTFRIMRSSQMAGWSEAALLSYLGDLKEAAMAGRNLFTEKYARMMQSTFPDEYARIEHLLPTLDLRVLELIEEIVTIVLKWEHELLEKYPHIVKRGRPISSDGDSPWIASLETYLKGELATYSPRTLELYLEHVKQQESNGVNGSAIILAQTLKQYGFASLDEANERLKAR